MSPSLHPAADALPRHFPDAHRLLDQAQSEVDAFMDKSNAWFMQRAGWITRFRERIPG